MKSVPRSVANPGEVTCPIQVDPSQSCSPVLAQATLRLVQTCTVTSKPTLRLG